MKNIEILQNFFSSPQANISIFDFSVNLLLAAILSFILSRFYIRYGKTLSNRRQFASNFILLTMTTEIIIMVVKSSLALSLGLVGALSIVRFRAAIKEPEELAYLFFAIAIGLGLGADQRAIILLGFIFVIGIIVLKAWRSKKEQDMNLSYLKIIVPRSRQLDISNIVETIKTYCYTVQLKRLDESKDYCEISFLVGFDTFEKFNQLKIEIGKLGDDAEVSFFDYKGFS